jgi:adenosylmethionine-8-amino-7-oxononanoate aminotransferase
VRVYGLIGALELIPRDGKAALTPTSMFRNIAVNLIRTQRDIVRGIRDLIAPSPPLIISHGGMDQVFDAVGNGLDKLWD